MHRRQFLQTALATTAAAAACPGRGAEAAKSEVVTVTGTVPAGELGTMLPHEHVLVDFIGADRVSPQRYDRDEAFKIIVPHLTRVRELGCDAMAECTPAYLGRDPELLRRLSQASGVRLLTNTGYYGAGQGKFLPPHAHTETADQLAARWIAEWQGGIDGTDVHPGFIKIGVDAGPLSEVNRKLIQAAARAHRQSGLTIAAHTGDGRAALEQLDTLHQEGVQASAWIWVHAQNEPDPAVHLRAAERGAWISLDGVSPTSIDRHRDMLVGLKQARLLDRVLISHDAGWYSVGEPRGGNYRGYETLFTDFLPALRNAGVTETEIATLTTINPAKAFSIAVRKR